MKRRITFYRKAADVAEFERNGAVKIALGYGPRDTIDRFEKGEVDHLLVPIVLSTGWHVRAHADDEVMIDFIGCDGEEYEAHRQQALNRVRLP